MTNNLRAVPRNFRLLDELEKGEKAEAAAYSYGLADRDDRFMYNWDATITVPPAGVRRAKVLHFLRIAFISLQSA